MKTSKEKPPTLDEMLEKAKREEEENERIYQERLKQSKETK